MQTQPRATLAPRAPTAGLFARRPSCRRPAVQCAAAAQWGVRLAGCGSSVPEKFLTNADLEALVETSDEWITTRTGIKKRHILAEGESMSAHAAKASQAALEMAGGWVGRRRRDVGTWVLHVGLP